MGGLEEEEMARVMEERAIENMHRDIRKIR